jgi:hypothetical protein
LWSTTDIRENFCRCYKGPGALQQLAASNRIIAEALKTAKNPERATEIEFPVVDLAARHGWDSGVVKRHLKDLQFQMNGGRCQVSVQ